MQRVNHLPRRVISIVLTIVMVASLFSGILPGLGVTAKATPVPRTVCSISGWAK